MLHIQIVGFSDKTPTIKSIRRILGGKISEKADVTRIPGPCTNLESGKVTPHIIVRDTSMRRGHCVAKILNQQLNLAVELQEITCFFPKK